MMLRFETSLPGYISRGTTWTIPMAPLAAMKSMFGLSAASRGVLLPSAAMGQSAIPSPMRIRYLRGTFTPPEERFLRRFYHARRLRRRGGLFDPAAVAPDRARAEAGRRNAGWYLPAPSRGVLASEVVFDPDHPGPVEDDRQPVGLLEGRPHVLLPRQVGHDEDGNGALLLAPLLDDRGDADGVGAQAPGDPGEDAGLVDDLKP